MGKMHIIYPDLRAEMARRNICYNEIMSVLGISRASVSLKLNGKRPLVITEAKQIRDELFPDMSLDDLFWAEETV